MVSILTLPCIARHTAPCRYRPLELVSEADAEVAAIAAPRSLKPRCRAGTKPSELLPRLPVAAALL